MSEFESEGYFHATPAICRDAVIVTGCDGYARLLDISYGHERMRIEMGTYVGASAAIRNQRLYVGTFDNQILCADLVTGDIVWRYERSARAFPFFASAAVTEDWVIVVGRDRLVHALDPETGDPRWTFAEGARVDESPVLFGERVCIDTP